MSPGRPRVAAAALLLLAAYYGLVSRHFAGAGVIAIALTLSMLLAARVDLGVFAQRAASAVLALLGITFGWLGAPLAQGPQALDRPWAAAGLAALAVATFRIWLRAPEGGFFVTFLIGLGALVACGETLEGPVYAAVVVAYLLAAFAALRAHDGARVPLRELPARGWAATVALVAIAGGAAAATAVALPPLSTWSRDRLLSSLGDGVTGLGDRMVLGSMEGMLQSDEIVARVYGPPTDYLRGVVYDRYQAGQWARSTSEGSRSVRTPPLQGSIRVVLVSGARDRYLVPLGAHAVAVAEEVVIADRFGALSAGGMTATEVAFEPTGAEDFTAAPPTQDDLRMPVKLAGSLRALVGLWTHGLTAPEDRVAAIAAHLRENYRYSLDYQRGNGDPLLDFLNDNRQGHCEYFASAMAMLARAAGVPARVVAGYRVAERSSLGDYALVREKNAHAWVEVHFADKGWQTVDATPEDLLPQNQQHATPLMSAIADLLAAWWGTARARAPELQIWHVIVALLAVIAVGLVVRRLRQRRRRNADEAVAFWQTEGPAPGLVRLLGALAGAGAARDASEPIERFAARLSRAEWGEARGLLLRYAALRYGGIGDAAALLGEMESCAGRLRRPG